MPGLNNDNVAKIIETRGDNQDDLLRGKTRKVSNLTVSQLGIDAKIIQIDKEYSQISQDYDNKSRFELKEIQSSDFDGVSAAAGSAVNHVQLSESE